MKRMFFVLFVLFATVAHAAPCPKVCHPAVQACVADGYTRASCRRHLRAACRATLPHVCSYIPTSTTTSTTSTTTSTTTLPAVWNFTGALTANPCGIALPSNIAGTVIVNADGSGTIAAGPIVGADGGGTWPLNPVDTTSDAYTWTALSYPVLVAGWHAPATCDGYLGIIAEPGNPAQANLAFTVSCSDGSTCQAVYSGTVSR